MILKSLFRRLHATKCPYCGCQGVKPEATRRSDGALLYRCQGCSRPFTIKKVTVSLAKSLFRLLFHI